MSALSLSTAPKPDLSIPWLLGSVPSVRAAAKDVLIAILTYVIAVILLGVGSTLGVVPAWVAIALSSFFLVAWGTIYALVRSGWSQRLAEPHLTFVRMLIDMGAMTLAYALIPVIRGATLQLLCGMLAFYMGRLNQRQILGTSLLAVSLMLITLLGLWWWRPETIVLRLEIMNLAMSSLLLPIAGFVGGEVYRVYQRGAAQRDKLKVTLQQLEHLSTRDSLTEVTNRRHMLTLLDGEIRRQERGGKPFCLALLDIDFFKLVNDTHGHPVGDQVLKAFAQVVGESIGPGGTLARWGGEEFLLLLPSDHLAHAHDTLANVHEAVHRHDWTQYAPGLQVRFSAGLAEHAPGEPVHPLLERIDLALYQAKQQGRDRTELAAPGAVPVGDWASPAAPTPSRAAPLRVDSAKTARPMRASAPTHQTETHPASSEHGWRHRLIDAVLGHDTAMRDRIRVILAGMLAVGFWDLAMYFYVIPPGLISPHVGLYLIVHTTLISLSSFALIRSGITRNWRDPRLGQVQLINGCFVAMVVYVHTPAMRAVLLQTICVLLIFGMVSLRARETRHLGGAAIVMVLAALWLQLSQATPDLDVSSEVLKVVVACLVFLQITVYSYTASDLRSRVLREHRTITRAVEQVHDLLVHDALTGLFNRSYLMEQLERERQRFARSQRRFCVAMIDLDHFKQINDTYGHPVGDEVLIEFAQLACAVMRDTDVIGRWGGEEFVIIMPETEPGPQGLVGLERLRERFSNHRLPGYPDLRLSFSCGVADFVSDEALEHTLQRADDALYKAKRQGRNRSVLAS